MRRRFLSISLALWVSLAVVSTHADIPLSRMSYLDNGHIRIGLDLSIGGAITYLSKSGSDVNLINSADWGRQIQMSFYSGPVPFMPHGKKPNPAWAGLGWNPIQSGDCFGNRSRVIESRNDGRQLFVRCIPMQWPLDNEPGECTFESRIMLDGNAVHVTNRLVNRRSEKTHYEARDQELPAIYTNGPWHRLITYTGDKPFTNDAVQEVPGNFPWSGWQATENWTALVNDAGWGVGVWEPGLYHFIGGFFGTPGSGGPHDSATGYIAPVHTEILDHDITYDFRYDLIVGSVAEIRRYVYQHAPKSTVPDYQFKSDRQHWRYANATDTGWPIAGELRVRLKQNDPQIIGPAGFWPALDAPRLYIRAAFHTGDTHAEVFWTRSDETAFSEAKALTFAAIPDGQFHTYAVDLSASPEYRGIITGLRLDPEPAGRPGDEVRLKSISFRKP